MTIHNINEIPTSSANRSPITSTPSRLSVDMFRSLPEKKCIQSNLKYQYHTSFTVLYVPKFFIADKLAEVKSDFKSISQLDSKEQRKSTKIKRKEIWSWYSALILVAHSNRQSIKFPEMPSINRISQSTYWT